MKLKFNIKDKSQADPFIFQDGNKFYLYVTAGEGVEAYSASDVFGEWKFEGVVTNFKIGKTFWAPSVIKYEDKYYMYVSFINGTEFEYMYVASADRPLGPFENEKKLYDFFSIDSHAVQTKDGLFLWFAMNSTEGERIGTRVFVDRLLDPYTVEGKPVEKIVPTFDEEIFTPSYREDNKWHTIEGPFWFEEGDFQYLMYSGGCYQDDTYHVGYSFARTNEQDLTKIEYTKKTNNGKFAPVIIKNEVEEGTGHHSVIKLDGEYYAIYHARDYGDTYRTARVCKLLVKDGEITAVR